MNPEGGGPDTRPPPDGILVRVQHHPDRAHLLGRLLPDLEGLRVEVVVDPDPQGPVSAWRTYRLCLEPHGGDWTVVIQDDALVADGFAEALPGLLDAHRGEVVALFVSGAPCALQKAVRRAHERHQPYARAGGSKIVPTVATAWPTGLAAELAEWADGYLADRELSVGDDNIVGKWCRDHGMMVGAPVPSWVQHPDDTQSLVRPPSRRKPGSGRVPFRVAEVWDGTAR